MIPIRTFLAPSFWMNSSSEVIHNSKLGLSRTKWDNWCSRNEMVPDFVGDLFIQEPLYLSWMNVIDNVDPERVMLTLRVK